MRKTRCFEKSLLCSAINLCENGERNDEMIKDCNG